MKLCRFRIMVRGFFWSFGANPATVAWKSRHFPQDTHTFEHVSASLKVPENRARFGKSRMLEEAGARFWLRVCLIPDEVAVRF